jgi:DNA-binding transcriptional regulator YiaG
MSDLHAAIASALVRKPAPLAPAEIRFLRKRLGYSQADFAKRMGVASESVSRWETGSVPMKATAEHLLRLMVVFEAPIPNYSTETLAKVTGRPEPAALRFTHTDAWRAA